MQTRILKLFAAAITVAAPSLLQAAVYEGFTGYSSPLANQGTSGQPFGWNFGQTWYASPQSGGGTGASTATIGSGSLTAPTGYVYQPGADTSASAAHVSDVGNGMVRKFADAEKIDLAADGTRYFSFLWSQSGTGGQGNIMIAFLDDATFGRRVVEFQTASAQLRLRVDNGSTQLDSEAFSAGTTYLLVGKIESTASGVDTVSASIWSSADAISGEPTTWDLTGQLQAGDTARKLDRIWITGSSNTDRFDEFRMGSSFEEVTGVPEPGSLGLLAAGAFLCCTRRK